MESQIPAPRTTLLANPPELKDPKYSLIEKVFESHNLPGPELITESDLWFEQEMMVDKSKNFLYLLWSNGLDKTKLNRSVRGFIIDIVYALNELHARIKKLEVVKAGILQKSKELTTSIEKLELDEESYEHQNQKFSISNDSMTVSFMSSERKSVNLLVSQELLTYYASAENDEFKQIREDGELDSCIIKITDKVRTIKIRVARMSNGILAPIATKMLPVDEIYTSFASSLFIQKNVPPTYLIIDYETDEDIKATNEVELKFDMKFSFETRIKVLRNLLTKNNQQQIRIEEKIIEAEKHLNHVLAPFKDAVRYKKEEGFIEAKEDTRSSCQSCNVF